MRGLVILTNKYYALESVTRMVLGKIPRPFLFYAHSCTFNNSQLAEHFDYETKRTFACDVGVV